MIGTLSESEELRRAVLFKRMLLSESPDSAKNPSGVVMQPASPSAGMMEGSSSRRRRRALTGGHLVILIFSSLLQLTKTCHGGWNEGLGLLKHLECHLESQYHGCQLYHETGGPLFRTSEEYWLHSDGIL